ncbi:excisionase family DNA-binding protein [Luteolibacter pohnpeiensis]|uniref:Excisionase family DNA-binding protein n=1 Tax=Luteolibacter pohnpeiensis TaxID=454153 RepID=A0A934SA27_9BACT|nr:excisionase family DNA-binding protein [Luteolibacter pohnpeiensis]
MLPLPSQIPGDKLLTKKAAAERLSISTRTLDRMVAAGKIDKIFVGSSPRFRKSEIDQIVARGI